MGTRRVVGPSIESIAMFRNICVFAGLATLATPLLADTGRLPSGVTPLSYDITVNPDATKLSFSGEEVIVISVAKPVATLTLNAADLVIGSAMLDGVTATSVKLNAADQTVTLSFAKPISAGEHKLSFAWTGKINTSASGMFALDYKNVDGSNGRMLATQFEAPDARRFAPMWDEPGYKAKFRLSAYAPEGQTAFSNMPVTGKEKTAKGILYRFAETPKMSSYLLFLGMGDVERKTKMVGTVEVGIISRRGVVDQGDYALDSAARVITYYNDYFGTPYPLPKLDMIAAPGSSQFFGAMENWGAILYFERRVLIDPKLETESQKQDVFTVVAHEIAHQWFGNLVTMAWWDDLWLNEGFASWMETKVAGDINPDWKVHVQAVAGGRQGAMSQDARSTTHPIVQKIQTVDQISQAFDSITYQKGEAVIGMLEASLGANPFRDGVRTYMAKNAYGNTVTKQLWDELAASSGQPVADLMRGFTGQGGVPMIRVGAPVCKDGVSSLTLSQDRFGLDALSKTAQTWKVPVALGLAGGSSEPLNRVIVSGAKPMTVSIPGCGMPLVNYGQSGYFRTLYTPAYFGVLKEGFGRLAVEDQIGLLADSFALANGDYTGISEHLALISSLRPDAAPQVWQLVASQLSGIDSRLDGSKEQPLFRSKAAKLLAPLFARVGWEAKAGEEPAVAQFRETLLPVMAQFGDPGVVADAKRYYDADTAKPGSVPPAIRLTALAAYSRNIDAAGWDALRARAKAEKSPVAQRIWYDALASAENKALAQRALDLALTDEAPVPVRSGIIATVSNEHPDMAFDWAAPRAKAIDALLESSSKSEFIVGLASGGSDLALAKRVTAYANANLAVASRAPARQAVALITYRADRKAKQSAAIIAWAKTK
jgi:aminopeptidase N